MALGIDAVVLSREAFQYWSIPKIGPEPDDGRSVEFIAEKSYGLESLDELNKIDMLLSQAYRSEEDAEFRKSIIDESGLRGCETRLCGRVVWSCRLVMAVGDCESTSDNGFIMVAWYWKLVTGDG